MDPFFKVLWMIFYAGTIVFVAIMVATGGGGNGNNKK